MFYERPKFESREKGPQVKEKREIKDGKLYHKTVYEYDGSGRVVRELDEYAGGGKFSREYVYDDKGRLIRQLNLMETYSSFLGNRQKILHEGELELSYDRDSKSPSLESYSRDGNVMEMKENGYDDNGRLIRRKTMHFDHSGDTSEREETFLYDEAGRLTERQEKNSRHPGEVSYFRNTYNEKGRLIREDRGIVGSETFGTVDFEHSEDGRTVTQTNRYGSGKRKAKVWESVERKDNKGNVVEFAHTAFEGGKVVRRHKSSYEYV